MDKIQIIAPKGAKKSRKIIGRGIGSGYGSTSGKGSKGQKCRSGGGVRPGFEGGQMPLYRRIATRGFSNFRFKKVYTIIKLDDLNIFEDGTRVTKEVLIQKKIIRKRNQPVKILSGGTLNKKLVVVIDKVSRSAQEAIIALGGEVIVKEKPKTAGKKNKNVTDTGKGKENAKTGDDPGKKTKEKAKDKVKDKKKTTGTGKEKTGDVQGKSEKKKKEEKSEAKKKEEKIIKDHEKDKEKAGDDGK
jgi:large subunit ribosomal protein L15